MMVGVSFVGTGGFGAKSAVLGFPQVEHLFKTDWEIWGLGDWAVKQGSIANLLICRQLSQRIPEWLGWLAKSVLHWAEGSR